MAEGVGRGIASSPITADWLVNEALRRYPTTGEIFVQMTLCFAKSQPAASG